MINFRFRHRPTEPRLAPQRHAVDCRILVLGYSEAGMFLRRPEATDIRSVIAIIDFARAAKDQGGILLCQCQAGISRLTPRNCDD